VIFLEYIEGIILKKLDYKESSKIIYLYTKKGIISVLIHGNRKLKNPYLNLSRIMNYVGLHVSGKDLLTLRDGDVIRDFRESKKDLEKFTYILHILELIYNVATHEHDHEKLLSFLLKIFDICEKEKDYIPYLNMIELKLLYLLGVNPLFNHCVSCERTDNLRFSVIDGGMCCPDHYIKKDVDTSISTTNLMKQLYYFDLQNPSEIKYADEDIRSLRRVLDRYYEYHMSFHSNSRKMLKGLIGY